MLWAQILLLVVVCLVHSWFTARLVVLPYNTQVGQTADRAVFLTANMLLAVIFYCAGAFDQIIPSFWTD